MENLFLSIFAIFMLSFSDFLFANQSSGEFSINFEICKKEQNIKCINIDSVKYVNKGSEFILNLKVSPSTEKEYEMYTVSYLPSKPEQLSGILADSSIDDYSKGIKSPVRKLKKDSVSYFAFDKSDPTGEYKIEVYIDEVLIKTLKFNVQ